MRDVMNQKLNTFKNNFSVLVRPRLNFVKNIHNENSSIIYLQAPAGYGKTFLLRQWCSELKEKSLVYEYFNAIDGKKAIFELKNFLQECEARSEKNEKLFIFIDDLHLFSEEKSYEYLQKALLQSPTQICWVISSRKKNDLGLSKLKLESRVQEFYAADLAFNIKEISAYYERVHQIPLKIEELKLIHQKTLGWPVALKMMGNLLQEKSSSSGAIPDKIQKFSGADQELAQYFYENLKTELTDNELLLRHLCLVDNVDCSLINRHFKLNFSELTRLEEEGLYLFSPYREKHNYHWHPLFQGFLQDQFRLSDFQQYQTSLERTYNYFWSKGDSLLSFKYASLLEDPKKIIEVLTKDLWELSMSSEVSDELEKSLKKIPLDIWLQHPRLYIASIISKILQFRYEHAELEINVLRENLRKEFYKKSQKLKQEICMDLNRTEALLALAKGESFLDEKDQVIEIFPQELQHSLQVTSLLNCGHLSNYQKIKMEEGQC